MDKTNFFKVFLALGLFSCGLLNAKKLFISFKAPGKYNYGGPVVSMAGSKSKMYDFLKDKAKTYTKKLADEISNKDFRVKTFSILNIGLFLVNYDKQSDVKKVKQAISSAIAKFEKRYDRKPTFKFNLDKGFEFYRTKAGVVDVVKKFLVSGKKVQFNDFILFIKNELDERKLPYKLLLKPKVTHEEAVYPHPDYYAQDLGEKLYTKGSGYENFRIYLKDQLSDLKPYSKIIKEFNPNKKKKQKLRFVSLYDLPYWKYTDFRKINLYSTYDKMAKDLYVPFKFSHVPDCTKRGEPFISLKEFKFMTANYIARSKNKKDPSVSLCQLQPYATVAKIYCDRNLLDALVVDEKIEKALKSIKHNNKNFFYNNFLDLSLFKGWKYTEKIIAKKKVTPEKLKKARKHLGILIAKPNVTYESYKDALIGGKAELLQDKNIEKHAVGTSNFTFTISKKVKEKVRYIKRLYRFFFN